MSRLASLLGTWLKRHHAFICLVFVWIYAGFWATMPLMGWGNYAPEPFGTSCTLDWWLAQASVSGQTFVMSILFFCLVLPTGIIVYSYVMIIYKVKSSAKEISNFDAQIRNSHSLEMKLTKVSERTIHVCPVWSNDLKLWGTNSNIRFQDWDSSVLFGSDSKCFLDISISSPRR